jgi:hypothetical protein
VAAPGSTWIVETVSQAAQRQNPQREEAVVPQADALE